MAWEWLHEACMAKKGACYDYKMEWQAHRFQVGGKMFAMLGGDKEGKPLISLKSEPVMAELLRGRYPDVVPGYYLNKQHWNSVYLEGAVPRDVILQMIEDSYRLVLAGLPAKKRRETTGDSEQTSKL